ncbi:MAG: transglycosylase SLT domain-containing protein [Acidobacteriota bacterium]|jgi:soluble lytic murein transglycosylase-like protein
MVRRLCPPGSWPISLLAPALVAVAALAADSPRASETGELAAHVREARWAEVRSAVASHPTPWPAEVALAAARAERHLGNPSRSREILRAALPHSGALAPALRLENAEAALALGEDPWSVVEPLLADGVDAGIRRAAAALLRRAWEELPAAALKAQRNRYLAPSLRRFRDAIIATRQGDRALALQVLTERVDDGPAARVARFLAGGEERSSGNQLLVGRALLATGFWREAEEWLARHPPPQEPDQRHQFAFLHGRALYRLGRLGEASAAFQLAVATAGSPAERHAAAVQLARCWELSQDWEAAGVAWELARQADPTVPAGWEGVARAAIMRGAVVGVCAPLAAAPATARGPAAERLAAVWLARSQEEQARACLACTDLSSPRARLLTAVADFVAGRPQDARRQVAALLSDPAAGNWRELALLLPPPLADPPAGEPEAERDLRRLAELTSRRGPGPARAALAAALASDPQWAELLGHPPPEPATLLAEIHALVRVGLEREAARLFARRFPSAVPREAAWSAAALGAWGNGPAALAAGERVWQRLGALPAGLLPAAVTRTLLPPELVRGVVTAAVEAKVSPALLAAVIRQESRFDVAALSPAGARGIAQLMPETARRLGASEEELWRPEPSLALAARELARLQERFGPRPAVIAAAYNAGDGVVESWLAVLGADCDDITFAAAIPYQETSTYVRAVLEGLSLARHLEES